MWQELQKGWIPPEHISEEEYLKVRDNKSDYPDYYVGYVGFHATFGAKYFGGYARGFKENNTTPRDMSNEAYRNTMSQLPLLKDVEFTCFDYKDIQISNAVIYCDPPYENTTKYETKAFNYSEFWEWCRKASMNNHVFISGYNAPDDFNCIWQKEYSTSLDCNRGEDKEKKSRTEKLFTYTKERKG